MYQIDEKTKKDLTKKFIHIISETNGIALSDTLELLTTSELVTENKVAFDSVVEFKKLLTQFQQNQTGINQLLQHPVSEALFQFFKHFPLKYHEEHIHLTGSISAEFIFPRLKKLLDGPSGPIYEQKIKEVYGPDAIPITSAKDIDRLIRLKEGEGFNEYLRILFLPKLILTSRDAHAEVAYHMAYELFHKYNVGKLRLKFTLSRAAASSSEQVPGLDDVTSEDVVLGLYDGFMKFKQEQSSFHFVLSPSFRKEAYFFDSSRFKNRKEHFMDQVNSIVQILEGHPQLAKVMTDVDTVGSENDLYRKEHFNEMKTGFRKLQYRGFKIRSHHGETWYTLKKGIQAVDNAMNIWHIDTLEHGISLGINPNFYFHNLYQETMKKNAAGEGVLEKTSQWHELNEMDWGAKKPILDKILSGSRLTEEEKVLFLKIKFHTAREVEHYQHDVLNRLIDKGASLISLPSSNKKLTGKFEDYKDHPFSWWEKKGVQLGVGTDNYVTLSTNFIPEMLILLFTDPKDLKITKLLMVTTGETRRPYLSHLLWKMRKLKNIS